jgi:hypothetical protein
MDESDFEYSVASQLAYDHYYNEQNVNQTTELLNNYLEGYSFDSELSNDIAVTIIRPDGSAIVAFRGTDPSSAYDLTADALIAFGVQRESGTAIPGSRFERAENLYKSANDKYTNVDLSGHSLGGTLAHYIGAKYGENFVTFNQGASPVELTENSRTKQAGKMYFVETMDLLSTSAQQTYGNQVEIRTVPQTVPRSQMLGSHSLQNFLPRQADLPLGPQVTIRPTLPITNSTRVKELLRVSSEIKTERNICEVSPESFPEICSRRLRPRIIKKNYI